MKRVLITGASGFVGSHLCELLSPMDVEVFGTVFGSSSIALENWVNPENLFEINLLDQEDVGAMVDKVKPEWVVHLAALSSPKASFEDHGATLTNNLLGQFYLLEALKKHSQVLEKVLVISSAEVYGKVTDNNLPISESCEFQPVSPYAVSKIAQDYLGLQYFLSSKLPIVRLRPANHTGERQSPLFVVSAFAQQIARIEAGQQKPELEVGNLEAIRDFTDVKDIVRAYLLALETGKPGEVYNIGSGKGVKISELLTKMIGMSSATITIKADEARMLPADIPAIVMDAGKFYRETGWQPEITLEQTLERMLHYWRQQVTLEEGK